MVYKKAEELQWDCVGLTHQFPRTKTLVALADQMDRSARSVKQNIVEGWKRNSSKEYYDFLGFSMGANSELEEDCDDIWKGMYPELVGLKGIMGERGGTGKMEEREVGGTGHRSSVRMDIESLPFYPLDPHLPAVVCLKLRCKELNFLFDRLQKSLLTKMESEQTLSAADKFQRIKRQEHGDKKIEQELLNRYSLKRLENGQVVKVE